MDNYPHDRRFATLQLETEGISKYATETDGRLEKVAHSACNTQGSSIKECPICLFTSDIAEIHEDGCEYCQLHDRLEEQSHPEGLAPAISRIQRQGRFKQYDCIIGISGGLDSSTLLYWAVMTGLRPLVIHFDNGFNNSQAESNMKNLVAHLNVNSITYRLDNFEYTNLNLAFLEAGVPDADIPNDIAMTKLMYQTADHYGIKWILNGHDFRTEGSTPAAWTYMDAKYIEDVYEKFTGRPLENYPLLTFWDQIKYAFKGIKQLRPFHYGFDRGMWEERMKEAIGWQDYGAKHSENIYTEYVGAKLLPEKFGIDKRRVYLSALIRSGVIEKSEAKLILQVKPTFDMSKFTDQNLRERIEFHAKSEIKDRKEFKRYNFKRWRAVIWLLSLLKVVPYTFYKKYCK